MLALQRLGERFWVVPALLCVVAAVLAESLVAVDRANGGLTLPRWLGAVVYRVGESGSRDILGAIASSTLAVAGTTFSITIAVMALTSSSYGPRLVRGFLADRGNQVVLGVFVATFLYCLLVLRTIRVVGDAGGDPFVPHLAVNGAVLLAVLDIGVLVYFIHHISDSIQVETLARGVRTDLVRAVDRVFTDDDGGRPTLPPEPSPDVDGEPVRSRGAGYVRRVREERLAELAAEHDVLLEVHVPPGRFVLEGAALAAVHPADRCEESLADAVRGAFEVTATRSPVQDVDFAVKQLTEMAVRALSPGTNDPYTAVHALDELSVGLVRLAARPVPDRVLRDGDGRPRVRTCRPTAVDVVRPVFDAMRWYGASAPMVAHHCLEVAARVGAASVHDDLGRELLTQVSLLRQAFEGAGHGDLEVQAFGRHAEAVDRCVRDDGGLR